MYYDYFGLKQPPFRITPDTSLFYPGGDRGAVLDALVYAILNGEGMVKVVGEVGSGKTMLCRMLEKELPDKVEIVYLANPSLSPENILHAIAFELKLPVDAETSRLQVMHNLQEYLLERHANNCQVVVFVEEAQAMPIATLEEIRLLSNLETQQSKLLQIVLFGQPELDELISKPEIRQLKERITYSFQLNPFVSEHIRDYLNTRLRASGYRAGEIFDKAAIRKIEYYSRGLLRRVNILADKALLAAYAGNTNQITANHVEQAARDSEFVSPRRWLLWVSLVLASVMLLIIVGLGLYQFGPDSDNTFSTNDRVPSTSLETTNKLELAPVIEEQNIEVSTNKQIELEVEPVEFSKVNSDTDVAETVALRETPKALPEAILEAKVALKPSLEVSLPDTRDEILQEEKIDYKSIIYKDLESQLLDLSILFELQDLGDPRLSQPESERLRRQLKDLPPEVALYQDSAQFSDICKLCWSILYRPVTEPENL